MTPMEPARRRCRVDCRAQKREDLGPCMLHCTPWSVSRNAVDTFVLPCCRDK